FGGQPGHACAADVLQSDDHPGQRLEQDAPFVLVAFAPRFRVGLDDDGHAARVHRGKDSNPVSTDGVGPRTAAAARRANVARYGSDSTRTSIPLSASRSATTCGSASPWW